MMKNLFFAVALLWGGSAFAQQDTLHWFTDMKQAAEASIKEKKPMFLFFTGSDWCGVCMKFQREVLAQPEFGQWAKEKVVLVELDFPHNRAPDPVLQEQNNMMKDMFGITGFPTIVFASAMKRQESFYYTRIGSTGYAPGGPAVWLETANRLLPKPQ